MKKHGMVPYDKEWWHFSDSKEYPVEETLTFVKPSRWTAEVSKNLSMRLRPDAKASTILKIPKNGVVKLLGYYKSYALVEYKGLCGYVQTVYLRPAPEAAWLPNSWPIRGNACHFKGRQVCLPLRAADLVRCGA